MSDTIAYAPRPTPWRPSRFDEITAADLAARPVVILPADAPHPQSHRPDLPLRSELALSPLEQAHEAEVEHVKESSYEFGYDQGRLAARDDAREEVAARLRTLETENAKLRAQLAQKAS